VEKGKETSRENGEMKMTWKTIKVTKGLKKDYGTVKAWRKEDKRAKNNPPYIQIEKIKDEPFYHRVYTDGYRYKISSNKFGTTHFKDSKSAVSYAKKLMKVK
jgi:hypothetical protein